MTVKNPERENQSLLCESAWGLVPRHFKIKGKSFFCYLYKSSESVRPYKRQTVKRCPSVVVGGWEGNDNAGNDSREEMLSTGSALHEHGLGLERGGRMVGKKERRWMGARIPKPSGEKANLEAEVVRTQMQIEKWKEITISFPSVPRKEKPGLPPTSHSPSLKAVSWEQPLSFRKHRDKRHGLPGKPSLQHLQASSFLKINLALISVSFRGIRTGQHAFI